LGIAVCKESEMLHLLLKKIKTFSPTLSLKDAALKEAKVIDFTFPRM